MICNIDHHWFEAFHVIAITAWMAGMFYLPRLFAYHADLKIGSEADLLFNLMQKRLLYFIMTPAMILAASLGLILAICTGHMYSAWLHMKLLFVVCMVALHVFFYFCHKKFCSRENSYTARFYKIVNELVTFIFIIIVIIAFTKPF